MKDRGDASRFIICGHIERNFFGILDGCRCGRQRLKAVMGEAGPLTPAISLGVRESDPSSSGCRTGGRGQAVAIHRVAPMAAVRSVPAATRHRSPPFASGSWRRSQGFAHGELSENRYEIGINRDDSHSADSAREACARWLKLKGTKRHQKEPELKIVVF